MPEKTTRLADLEPDGSVSAAIVEEKRESRRVEQQMDLLRLLLGDFTEAEWHDWRWQFANRLHTIEHLDRLIRPGPCLRAKLKRVIQKYPFAVTPYYLSLINWNDPDDPMRQQCLPAPAETEFAILDDEDPLEEREDMAVSGLVHRYPDRVLLIATNTCAMYCRHCTRKRIWDDCETERSPRDLERMVDYVAKNGDVRDVCVSGGDPLTMQLDKLDWLLGKLRAIPHVEVIRIGTRVPVVLPMRIDDEVCGVLDKHGPIWLNTQFNHPREVTPEAAAACDRLMRAGVPVSNQSVLLRGINDSPEVMTKLCHELLRIKVRPYYLFQCDPVRGTEHFRTSIWAGLRIIEMMRGHTSGLAVPTFVVDVPGGGGKIPLQPAYLLSATENEVLLRNYEGMIVRYFNPQKADFLRPHGKCKPCIVGTARLFEGSQTVLIPEDNQRLRRRRERRQDDADRADLRPEE